MRYQLALILVLIGLIVNSAESSDDDEKCRAYLRSLKVDEDIISKCGPFEMIPFEPILECGAQCSMIHKKFNFRYKEKFCCCSTYALLGYQ